MSQTRLGNNARVHNKPCMLGPDTYLVSRPCKLLEYGRLPVGSALELRRICACYLVVPSVERDSGERLRASGARADTINGALISEPYSGPGYGYAASSYAGTVTTAGRK